MTHPVVKDVSPAVVSLLDGFLDYAGLFPPASLEMPAMVESWERHLRSQWQWMVGRVVVPASLLGAFEEHASDVPQEDDDPWCLSVLCKGDQLTESIDAVEEFTARHRGVGMVIDVLEISGVAPAQIDEVTDGLPEDLFPFLELQWRDDVRGAMAALAGESAGAKIRTGGITPDLYPDPAALARFIGAAARAGVPFKATAGLHHPTPHTNASVPAREFGFLAVLAATAMAQSGEGDQAIESLLAADDLIPAMVDGSVQYGDVRLDGPTIDRLRATGMISIGSCSIDDPIADLTRLGLLGTGETTDVEDDT